MAFILSDTRKNFVVLIYLFIFVNFLKSLFLAKKHPLAVEKNLRSKVFTEKLTF